MTPFLFQIRVMPTDADANLAASLALGALAFVVAIIVGRPMVTYIRQRKIGKKIRDVLPEHSSKAGTPTMGGVIFCLCAILLTLVFVVPGRISLLLPVAVMAASAVLGGFDDAMNLLGGKGSGMTARAKMLGLLIIATVATFILHLPSPLGMGLHHVYVPFWGRVDIGLLYIPIAIVAIAGLANAVNLTDGLDGLAAGTSAIAFCAYGIVAYRQGQLGVVAFCFIMVGALMGFLWFNAPKAQIIMGDLGALAIGSSLAVAAFMTGQWLLLPIVGFVFIAEMVSVMLQVIYFKLTGGRRLFRRTPIHHHFELLGWSETQVTIRFWLIGLMTGLLGIALALL